MQIDFPPPLLFYRSACSKCHLLSGLVVWISLGKIQRIPMSSQAAQDLYEQFPDSRGKLALSDQGQMLTERKLYQKCITLTWQAWQRPWILIPLLLLLTFPFIIEFYQATHDAL